MLRGMLRYLNRLTNIDFVNILRIFRVETWLTGYCPLDIPNPSGASRSFGVSAFWVRHFHKLEIHRKGDVKLADLSARVILRMGVSHTEKKNNAEAGGGLPTTFSSETPVQCEMKMHSSMIQTSLMFFKFIILRRTHECLPSSIGFHPCRAGGQPSSMIPWERLI